MAFLFIAQGSARGRQYPLSDKEMVIGRSPTCDIVLSEPTVSRRHARISSRGGRHFLEDLGSQHGTVVNGELIRGRQVLNRGAEIQVGDCMLTYTDTDDTQVGSDSGSSISVLDVRQSLSDHQSATGQKLRAVLEIMHNMGVSLDVQELFPKILQSVLRLFPFASRGCILLEESPGGRLVPKATQAAQGRDPGQPEISRTIVDKVMRDGQAVLTADAWEDVQSESVYRLDLRSVMCAPLLTDEDRPTGMIQVDTQDPVRPFTDEDLQVLVTIATLAGRAMAHAKLHATQVEFQRQEQDLELAKRLQMHFLPQEPPELEGYELASYYQAAHDLGGDYYSFLPLLDGRLAIAVADVAGKGASAALLMARLCSDVRFSLAAHARPADAVEWLNQQMCTLDEYDRFITFALGVLDPAQHRLAVCNAGHPPPVWRAAADAETVMLPTDMNGPPLGVQQNWQYQQTELELAPGACLLLYTDGISEAANSDGQLFGIDRITQVVQAQLDAHGCVKALRQNVQSFVRGAPQSDDICVVALRRTPPSS